MYYTFIYNYIHTIFINLNFRVVQIGLCILFSKFIQQKIYIHVLMHGGYIKF